MYCRFDCAVPPYYCMQDGYIMYGYATRRIGGWCGGCRRAVAARGTATELPSTGEHTHAL